MKIAISIPDALFEAAETLAGRLGVTRSELYRRALAHYLRQSGHKAVTAALDAVYGEDQDEGGLDPAVDWLQGVALLKDDAREW